MIEINQLRSMADALPRGATLSSGSINMNLTGLTKDPASGGCRVRCHSECRAFLAPPRPGKSRPLVASPFALAIAAIGVPVSASGRHRISSRQRLTINPNDGWRQPASLRLLGRSLEPLAIPRTWAFCWASLHGRRFCSSGWAFPGLLGLCAVDIRRFQIAPEEKARSTLFGAAALCRHKTRVLSVADEASRSPTIGWSNRWDVLLGGVRGGLMIRLNRLMPALRAHATHRFISSEIRVP